MPLALFADPRIEAAVSGPSDFSISDLMCSSKPLAVYLAVPGSDRDRMVPWVRAVLGFVQRSLMVHEHTDRDGIPKVRRLLICADEAPSRGYIAMQVGGHLAHLSTAGEPVVDEPRTNILEFSGQSGEPGLGSYVYYVNKPGSFGRYEEVLPQFRIKNHLDEWIHIRHEMRGGHDSRSIIRSP